MSTTIQVSRVLFIEIEAGFERDAIKRLGVLVGESRITIPEFTAAIDQVLSIAGVKIPEKK